jgi:hypothetical protein
MQMPILAIDPGNVESAYVLIDDDYTPFEFAKVENEIMLEYIKGGIGTANVVIEMVASYGMPVGKEVFETVYWIGRFVEAAGEADRLYRHDVKMNLCQSMRAKDSNIRQALIDRFGVVGTKKEPGWFYGFKKDIWQAYALGVTYLDAIKGA